jgi:hypothetical protein
MIKLTDEFLIEVTFVVNIETDTREKSTSYTVSP